MPYSAFRELPLESLQDLLISTINDAFKLLDGGDTIGFNSRRKLIEIIMEIIEEKKQEKIKSD